MEAEGGPIAENKQKKETDHRFSGSTMKFKRETREET